MMNTFADSLALSATSARALRLSVWLCAIAAVILWTGPALLRVDLFNGDARQHVYWLYRYADPQLFPNDLSIEYFGSNSVAPWGYRALYSVLAAHADALFVAKLVSSALLLVTLWLAYLLGAALVREARPLAGLLAVAATIILLPLNDLLPPMGFQRTFALPIALLCLWALVAKRYAWVGVSWMLAALLYPVLIPVLGLTAAIVFLADLIRDRRLPPMWHWNAMLGVATVALVVFGSGTPDGIGPMVTYKQALAMAEFGPHGRQDLFSPGGLSAVFYHHRTGLGWSPYAMLAIACAAGLAIVLGSRKLIPQPAWILAGVGLGLWLLARLFLFYLYLPNRHARHAIAGFAIVAFCAAGYALLGKLLRRSGRSDKPITLAVAALAPLVVIAVLWPGAAAAWHRPVDQDMERAYAFLATLPKDTVIAAHPDLADNVPLRTRRSVLASTEESIAFMTGYYARLTPRLQASLRAAYATSWDEVQAAFAPYKVDVMLTAPSVFAQSTYYPPFDGLVGALYEKGRTQGFILQRPPADRVLFQSGEVYVLRVGAQ
jgi:hypothetical protein